MKIVNNEYVLISKEIDRIAIVEIVKSCKNDEEIGKSIREYIENIENNINNQKI
jgi:hypothetical protein